MRKSWGSCQRMFTRSPLFTRRSKSPATTNEEHTRFLHGLELFGKKWTKIADVVGSRTSAQVQSHGQKYFQKHGEDVPPAPRAAVRPVPQARPRARPAAPLPPAARRHIASTASAWVAVCTDLLDALKDRTNMKGIRRPLTSRGFICGPVHQNKGATFNITVPPDFPCYYDVVGKDYIRSLQGHALSLSALRNYLEGALALARAGDAYRTDAEYKDAQALAQAPARTSRFTGVNRHWDKWVAVIYVGGSKIPLGDFDDEENAARAHDAARVKYRGESTVNFPGEAPLAAVLAALPPLPPPPHATAAMTPAAPRHDRSLAARRVIFSPPPSASPSRHWRNKPVEMRQVGDAAWRYFGSRTDAAKAFGVSVQDVTRLINDPSTAPVHVREALEARLAPALKKQVIKWKLSGRTVAVTPVLVGRAPSKKRGLFVEGAAQKVNGKWSNSEMFPGREFDDLDAYRAAKKQRKERRAAYADNYL